MRRALPLIQCILRFTRPVLILGLISNLVWSQATTVCPAGTVPKITSVASVTFTVGVNNSFAIAASGNPLPTISESGALPSGISFRRGQFRGTPAAGTANTYHVMITASNTVGSTNQAFILRVLNGTGTGSGGTGSGGTGSGGTGSGGTGSGGTGSGGTGSGGTGSGGTGSGGTGSGGTGSGGTGSGGTGSGGTGSTGDGSLWIPPLVTSWQWQLSSLPSTSSLLAVQMYDIDGFDAGADLVAALHAQGTKAVCYIDAGTWENWRSDAASFPASVEGAGNGWPGEKWLDIRQISLLAPIMTARFQMCKTKGFDAVEPDNIDGYTNSTGFPLKASDQIAYNSWIADTVHSLGMSVALKNDTDQVPDLLSKFDFMIDEQCFEFSECNTLVPFINAGKAVFEVEYSGSASTICPKANAMNFNTLLKDLDLTATRTACR